MVRKWSSKSKILLKSKLPTYDTVLLDLYGNGYEQLLLGSPFLCMHRVLSGANSVVQCLLSSGTVWKSSSLMFKDSGEVVLELVEVSMGSLSSLKYRQQCTGLAGECVRSLVDEAGLHGVPCAGLKEACSKLETWCMHCGLHKDVGTLRWNHFHSLHLPVIAAV